MNNLLKNKIFWVITIVAVIAAGAIYLKTKKQIEPENPGKVMSAETPPLPTVKVTLDNFAYEQKLNQIANNSTSTPTNLWPVKTTYPNYGALLPFNRIVAYYGNLYSRGMGVLGEYPENVMLDKLNSEVEKWNKADPTTPVIPALHYIAVVAQAGGGKDGKFRLRMPDKEIDRVLGMAQRINGIVFLDIQVGLSNVQTEIPLLEKYLKLPNVHLGIDPEFAMKNGQKPGTAIGSLDASEINFAAEYLAKVVRENNLPPKVLVIHRFTRV